MALAFLESLLISVTRRINERVAMDRSSDLDRRNSMVYVEVVALVFVALWIMGSI